MGSDVAEWLEALPSSFKVHSTICLLLRDLVCRIRKIIPDIESARPGCSSGMKALCSLNDALERTKNILQHNANSSKLYMAITADRVLLRCRKAKNLLQDSLCQIQSIVPVMLAVEIYRITEDLKSAIFSLDPSEEEAGRVVWEMMQKTPPVSISMEEFEIKALQLAAEKLKITSFKALVAERRLLKRLLDETGVTDPKKAKILKFLLSRLRRYGNRIIAEREEETSPEVEATCAERNSCNNSVCARSAKVESCSDQNQNVEIDALGRPIPPDDYRCPLSHGLMSDPVVIASGLTFERVWIQKWFDEGNHTCPKDKVKLDHLLLTPNTTLKGLILKWCLEHEITIHQSTLLKAPSLDLSMASIASFGSSIDNLCLLMDGSSIEASDASSCLETSELKTLKFSSFTPMEKIDSDSFHSDSSLDGSDSGLLCKLSELPWSSQRKLVEDARTRLKHINRASQSISAETFVKPLIDFLRNALDLQDLESLRAGSGLLLDFLEKNRRAAESLSEDSFRLLSQLLCSEATIEGLKIIKLLSGHSHGRSKIISSGALPSILKVFDDQIECQQEQAVIVLRNMFSNTEICSKMASLQCIPRLTPFLNKSIISRHALVIFRHLCDTEPGRFLLTETRGCISSLSKLLEDGTAEEQEHVVYILHSLCSPSVRYCRLVMSEGINVIQSLSYVSMNGNKKAKVMALELLRNLMHVDYDNDQEVVVPDPGVDPRDDSDQEPAVPDPLKAVTVPTVNKPSSKPSRFFGIKFPLLGRKKGSAF